MSRATPRMRTLAERLIAYETGGKKSGGLGAGFVFQGCDKLRPHLAPLMGVAGFRAILARAHALAQEEVGWLRAVHVKSEGTLAGLEEAHAQVAPDDVHNGKVVLLAQFLGLLMAFVGERLMLQMVRDVWPGLSLTGLDFTKGNSK